jgi:hypothetical protein
VNKRIQTAIDIDKTENEILKVTDEKDRKTNSEHLHLTGGLAQWRHYPADNFVGN